MRIWSHDLELDLLLTYSQNYGINNWLSNFSCNLVWLEIIFSNLIQGSDYVTKTRISNNKKKVHFNDKMYLKAKNLIVNLVTIGQPVTEGIKFYNFLEVLEPTTTP